MILFEFDDYQEFLKANIRENSGQRGYLTRLAKAAGCQKSYLSQVVKGQVHFTPEHAMRSALFWNFNESEAEYFIQLVHLGRTSFQPLKNKIKARLKAIRTERKNLAQRFQQDSIQDARAEAVYYSGWIPSALHVIVGIEEVRTNEAISRYLSLPISTVKAQMESLERLGLVKRQGQQWMPTGKNLHLPKDSIFTAMNHQNWRARALIDSQRPDSDGIHYTAIQTLSLKDFEEIKDLILRHIDQQRKIIGPSQEETIACFTCDWFKAQN